MKQSMDEYIENHNFVDHGLPFSLDVNAYIGSILANTMACADMTGSVGISRHACATEMAGLSSS